MTLHDTPPVTDPDPALDHLDAGPVRPPSKGFSMRLAMIVPGLGVLILGVFITAGFLTSNPVQQTSKSTTASPVIGSTLQAVGATAALKPIVASGEPPGNIINAVSIPTGSVAVAHQDNGAAANQYDAQVTLRSDASQGALDAFFKSVMKKQGWQLFDEGPADHVKNGLEVLGKQAGSDGFYWEMGAVISATSFGSGAPPTGETHFTIRLFQVPDPD